MMGMGGAVYQPSSSSCEATGPDGLAHFRPRRHRASIGCVAHHRDHVGTPREDRRAVHSEEHAVQLCALLRRGARDVRRVGVIARHEHRMPEPDLSTQPPAELCSNKQGQFAYS